MVNQFEGKYGDLGKVLHIERQEKYNTFKVVDPDNEDLFWGGFKTIAGARRYAYDTLYADYVRLVPTRKEN